MSDLTQKPSDNKSVDTEKSSKSSLLNKEYRNRLYEERKSLLNALLDQSGSFDKWVLTFSSGALALSLTFIEKIVSHPHASTINILVSAWSSFGFSILLTLISFLISQRACLKNIETLEKMLSGSNKKSSNPFTTITGILNWLSMSSFVIGVALLITFTTYNISSVVGG